jgi:hypothetical protein
VIQHWECIVDEVSTDAVYMRLLDVTGGALMADETAEVPIKEFTEKMLSVMVPGTLLAWFIHETPEGPASTMKLHTETWTKEDIERAEAEAAILHARLNRNVVQ